MYKIENYDEIYVIYKPRPLYSWDNKIKIEIFKTEKELISFLAHGYLEKFKLHFYSLVDINCNDMFNYEYYDGFGRRIEPYIYRKDAWIYYTEHLKKSVNNNNYNRKKRVKKKTYHGKFRETPVSGTGKWKKGKSSSTPKYKHIRMMYDNPEYKMFNRGNSSFYPCGKYRHIERNWKSQRKHQWKETA